MHDVKAECPACDRLHFPWCEPHNTADTATSDVLAEIAAERRRQDDRWGEQNHPDGTDEAWRAAAERARTVCQKAAADGTVTWRHILAEEFWEAMAETDPAALRTELVQLAAVAVAQIEDIDWRSAREPDRG